MDAVGFLCLILFFIGLGLAVYYAYICYDVPSSRTHTILQSDDGSLQKYPNDFNGNESVVIPLDKIDEPDIIGHSGGLPNGSAGSGTNTEEASPSAPESLSKNNAGMHCGIEHVQMERAAPGKTQNLLDIEPLRRLPNSDEEDGLIFSQESNISAASAITSGRLHGPTNGDKHVHFPYIDTDDVGEGASCDMPLPTESTTDGRIAFRTHDRLELNKYGKCQELNSDAKLNYNPIHDIKVQVILPSSTQSSCEELRTRSSDTDTSEPDVTEYSFTTGPKVPSTSQILADEISTSLEPKVTKITPLNDSTSNGRKSLERTASSDSCSSTDSNDSKTFLPSEEQLSINTPPNTPPEGEPRDKSVFSNTSAKVFAPKSTQSSSFIVIKNYRSGSMSSTSSLSVDELDVTSVKPSACLIKK